MSPSIAGRRVIPGREIKSGLGQGQCSPRKRPKKVVHPHLKVQEEQRSAMGGLPTVKAKAEGGSESDSHGQASAPSKRTGTAIDEAKAADARPEPAAGASVTQQEEPGTATEAADADSLAKDLENLKIRPNESDQVGTSVADDLSSDDEEGYASILTKMKQALAAEKKKPKEVLKPLLDTFDLAGIADYIKKGKAKRIIVMCGAGISVSAGIPDFRSPKTGLYHNLKKFNLPHPQAVFELDYFRQQPKAFYQLAKELFPGRFQPTPAHYFMTLLHQKGLLLRCFTQNIDSLEREAHLPKGKVVAAHGNFDTAHCISCGEEIPQDVVRKAVDEGQICTCPACKGYVKPDIVFFGENLPEDFFVRAQEDFPRADLLIVMGTSLIVNPFASLIDHVGDKVPRVLINRERVGEADAALLLWGHRKGFSFDEKHRDALFLGDCDDAVRQLAGLLGWEKDLDALIKAGGLSNL